MGKIKLILADDHPLIREGFKSLLGKSDAFEVVGEAETGKELIDVVKATSPDIILVDITMPQMNGLDAIEVLRKEYPLLKFMVLTMHEEREYILKALRNGAHGYVLKSTERAELERAIHAVYNGQKYFSPVVTTVLAESVGKKEDNEYPEITPREKEVLELVAGGRSTKQIADKLKISIRTVESHRINMLKKFDVNNTAELIKRAIELKLIS